jgi:hypothetical protein
VVPATEEDLKLWERPQAWSVPLEQLRAMRSKTIKKSAKPGRDPRDGDGDGKIFDGTPEERPARDDVGRRHTDDKVAEAAKSPDAAARAFSRTKRPSERMRLAESLKKAGMSDEDIATAKKSADNPPEKRPNKQQDEPKKADAGGRVLFEAAPDPNDKELTDQWRGLKDEDRVAISRDVVNSVMPEVAAKIGVDVSIQEQLGGYLDDTNPSFAATFKGQVDPAKFIETMKAAGFAMSQDSMMGISQVPIEGAERAGFVTVSLPEGADVHETYMKIRSMDPSVQGHTTIGREMTIVDFTGRHKEIADSISSKLGLDASDVEGYAVFVEKKDYGYGSEQEPSGQPKAATSDTGQADQRLAEVDGKQQWGDNVRSKASSLIRERISAAKSGAGAAGGSTAEAGGKVDGSASGESGSKDSLNDWSKTGNFAIAGEKDQEGNANLQHGLQIPRHKLPQIRAVDQPELIEWLKGSGVGVTTGSVDPASLIPVQSQVSPAKIDKMIADDKAGLFDIAEKPVLVSRDGYLVDGHHRAIASAANGKQIGHRGAGW